MIEITSVGSLREDDKQQIEMLLASTFDDPKEALRYGFIRNDNAIVERTDEISGFLLFNEEQIEVEESTLAIAYFGMIASCRNTGIRSSLRLIKAATDYLSEQGVRIGWGRTSNPLLLPLVSHCFSTVAPSAVGGYTDREEQIFLAIAKQLGQLPRKHAPYFLPSAAKHNYRLAELRRFQRHLKSKPYLQLFDKLGFDFSRGDRIAFVSTW